MDRGAEIGTIPEEAFSFDGLSGSPWRVFRPHI